MFQIVAAYDQMNSEQKTAHLHKNGLNVVRTLVNLTVSISNEKVRTLTHLQITLFDTNFGSSFLL